MRRQEEKSGKPASLASCLKLIVNEGAAFLQLACTHTYIHTHRSGIISIKPKSLENTVKTLSSHSIWTNSTTGSTGNCEHTRSS